MNGIRIVVVVWLALAALPLTTFAQPEREKQSSVDETRVARLEQEIKVLRQMNESNLALIEKLITESRENSAIIATVRNQTEFQTKLVTVLSSNESKWIDRGIAVLALIISVFVWKINKQIAWFTGAMESHSTKTLMLKAAENPKVTLKWWDPLSKGPKTEWPPTTAKHDEKIDLTTIHTIHFGVPLEKRTRHSCFARFKVWCESTCDWIRVCAKGSTVKEQPSSGSGDDTKPT